MTSNGAKAIYGSILSNSRCVESSIRLINDDMHDVTDALTAHQPPPCHVYTIHAEMGLQ